MIRNLLDNLVGYVRRREGTQCCPFMLKLDHARLEETLQSISDWVYTGCAEKMQQLTMGASMTSS